VVAKCLLREQCVGWCM